MFTCSHLSTFDLPRDLPRDKPVTTRLSKWWKPTQKFNNFLFVIIGRTESIWDYELHKNPNLTDDKSNGDIACDSYHKWREDIKLIKDLGVDFYRFSISWSRILPSASKGSELSQDGVLYYNNIIDELIANDIVPYITIFHWDTPQSLEFQGGCFN